MDSINNSIPTGPYTGRVRGLRQGGRPSGGGKVKMKAKGKKGGPLANKARFQALVGQLSARPKGNSAKGVMAMGAARRGKHYPGDADGC